MNPQEALRHRLADLETDVLWTMWRTQDREGWAEDILKTELEGRGAAASDLATAAQQRSITQGRLAREASARDTFLGIGVLGRFGAVAIGFGAGGIVGGHFGAKAGMAAFLLCLSIYLGVLVHHLTADSKKTARSHAAGLALLWMEAAFLGCVVLVGFAWLVFGRATPA